MPMNESNFKLIGVFDTSKFKDKLLNLPPEIWVEYDFRQIAYYAHRNTQTIPIIDDMSTVYTQKHAVLNDKNSKIFTNELKELNVFFKNYYKAGKMRRCSIVKLLKNSDICKHVDKENITKNTKRHHIPIITDNNVLFEIDGEIKNMSIDEVWLIDNSKKHAVYNSSQIDRIHLIVDWYLES